MPPDPPGTPDSNFTFTVSMSSIHYPTMSSPSRHPFETQSRTTSPSKHGAVVPNGFTPNHSGFKGARPAPPGRRAVEEEEQSAKKRRASFPPIPPSRHQDAAKVAASPKSRHSMAEVVARMRVREKTLLGEDLLKRREKGTESGAGKLSTNGAIPTIGVEGGVRSEMVPSSHARAEWLASPSGFSSNTRTRKNGTVAFNNAWGTPRGPTVGAFEVRGISKHSGSSPLNDVRVVTGHSSVWHHDHHHSDNDEDSVDSPVEETSVVNDVDSDNDDDFDFDEGEDEGEFQNLNFYLNTDNRVCSL